MEGKGPMNMLTLIIGVLTTLGLMLLVMLIISAVSGNWLFILGPLTAIFVLVGWLPTTDKIDIGMAGCILFLNRRTSWYLDEKRFWLPQWIGLSYVLVDTRERSKDIPRVEALSKGKTPIPMWGIIKVFFRIFNPVAYLSVEPETFDDGLITTAQEALGEFIINHTYLQNYKATQNAEKEIAETMDSDTLKKWGVTVTNIDFKDRIQPIKKIKEELEDEKSKQIKDRSFVDGMKKLEEETPGVPRENRANILLINRGIVKKEVRTINVGVEGGTLNTVAALFSGFLPKKKEESEKDTSQGGKK